MTDKPKPPETNVVEFIPRQEWEKKFGLEAGKIEADSPMQLPKELNRRRVVSAFMDCFELMGGTGALMDWATRSNENQTNFYKLYSRLMPSQAVELDDADRKTYLGHVLPMTALDK